MKIRTVTMEFDVQGIEGTLDITFEPPVTTLPHIQMDWSIKLKNQITNIPNPFIPDTPLHQAISDIDKKHLKQSWVGTWKTDKDHTVRIKDVFESIVMGYPMNENNKVDTTIQLQYDLKGNPHSFVTEEYGKLMRRLDTEASYVESVIPT